MIEKKIAQVRVDKAALAKSSTDTADNLVDLASRWMGDTRPTNAQVEKQHLIERAEAEVRDLNDRYGNEKCGSLDVDQKMSLPTQPGDVPVKQLKSHEPQFKVK